MSVKEMYMGREMTGTTTLAESVYNEMGGDTPLITESQTVKGAVNELKTIEGTEAYDNTATYAVGDYCIYNSTRYKCITAVTTAEDFDSTKWLATTTNNDISKLNSSLISNLPMQLSEGITYWRHQGMACVSVNSLHLTAQTPYNAGTLPEGCRAPRQIEVVLAGGDWREYSAVMRITNTGVITIYAKTTANYFGTISY